MNRTQHKKRRASTLASEVVGLWLAKNKVRAEEFDNLNPPTTNERAEQEQEAYVTKTTREMSVPLGLKKERA